MDPVVLVALAAVAGVAGWVDAIAGGGGLLQLPALFVAGVPVPAAFGVNKASSICGTSAALARYAHNGSVEWRVVAWAGPLALVGSVSGVLSLLAAVKAAAEAIRPAFAVVFLALAAQQAVRAWREGRAIETAPARRPAVALLFVLAIGFYDGLIGPGTGMFLFWALTTWLALPPLAATGTTKALNWIANAGALATLLSQGQVIWAPALAMASANLLGGLLGARTAIRRGVRFVRLTTATVSGLAALYLLVEAVVKGNG
jgi:hypothetical protein